MSSEDAFIGTIHLAAGTFYVAVSQNANRPTAFPGVDQFPLTRPDGFAGGAGGFRIFGAATGVSSFTNNTGLDQGLAYTLNISLAPEPETYAMLIAGLGLPGFVAHRKKRLQGPAAV